MVKGRVRVKPGKAKRWRKGQSGGTNPVTKTHREAAKGRFGNHLAQGRKTDSSMKLTTDVLASHDSNQKDVDLEEDHIDDETQSGLSLGTSSAYSLVETSHSVFGKVKRLWNSSEESHREICAVLAAVSEVVKAKSGMESETEYFAALLTALEASEEELSTAAIAFLLSVVMEKTPHSILETQFSLVSKVLMNQLTENENTDSTALLKSLISCVIILLSVQPAPVWTDSSVHSMIQTVLNFSIHPKPRLRKSVQKGLVSMLREGGNVDNNNYHPSCILVFKQCQRMIGMESTDTVKLHVLGLLKECLGNFTTKQIKGLCESILKLLTLGTSIMKMTGLQCMNGMFKTSVGPQGMTAELNGQIISALYSHQPSLSDSQLLMAWSTVMESAHICLHKLNQSLSVAHLPKIVTVLMNCLLAKRKDSVKLTTQILKNILQSCVSPLVLWLETSSTDINRESEEYICVQSIFSVIETGLKYKYCEVWNHVLDILQSFYEIVTNGDAFQFIRNSLQTINELYHTPNFPYISELEAAFGTAIRSMGPRFVLSIVPLKLDENRDPPDFPQSWILPVLKSSVHKTDLSFYTDQLLPLAGRMRLMAEEWRERGKQLEGKLYETLELQVWSLLPSFCKECTDIAVSFPSIAKILGTALTDKPAICTIICQSLINIIDKSKVNDDDRLKVAKFSKNFIPILFNLYTAEKSPVIIPQHDTVLNCIRSYLSITEYKLVDTLFSKLLSKLSDNTTTSTTRLRTSLEDIIEVFIPFLSRDNLSKLFDFVTPILDSGDLSEQKKSYKLLNSILSCESQEHTAFIDNNLAKLQELLLGSLSTAGAGSKKPRLRCLIQIVSKIGPESSDFIEAVTPEAILCTKEANEKCRNIAYLLLKNLGYSSQRCYDTTAEESIQRYFSIVIGCLKGSTHMISATIGTMARLVYEFNDLLGSELVSKLLSSVCVFFSAKSKEVVRSTLIFIKVVVGVLPPSELAPHVEELVTKILKWNENHKSHFRMKSRYILEKLTQKFSYEMVEEFVPEKHKRLMTHIRKMMERKKKLQKSNKSNDMPKDDNEDYIKVKKRTGKPSFEELLKDSDDDNDDDATPTNINKGGKRGTWLQEGEDDDPLDFMDPSVTKRIIGTKPSMKKSERRSEDFKTDLGGKMIIHDDDEMELSEDDDDMMIMENDNSEKQRMERKRKMRHNDGDNEQDNNGIELGKGIYRKDPKKKDYGSEYRAKKAKGDIKKAGRPDPYAYIQLDRKKLNKRKRSKLSGQFNTILHKAQKGSMKGKKQKSHH